MMNPFQLALLNTANRILQVDDALREFGPMAINGLLGHGYVENKNGVLRITRIGRLALSDFEKEIDKKS